MHAHVHARACSSTLVICPSPSMSIWSKSSSACHMHIYTYVWDQICTGMGSIYTCLVATVRGMVRHARGSHAYGVRTVGPHPGQAALRLRYVQYSTQEAGTRTVRVPRTAAALYGYLSTPPPAIRLLSSTKSTSKSPSPGSCSGLGLGLGLALGLGVA